MNNAIDKNSNIKKSAGKLIILAFCFLFFVFCFGFFIWQGIYSPKDIKAAEEKIFSVEKSQNLFQIAENLEKEGLIKNRFLFNFYVLVKRAHGNLQAGEYFLSPSITITEIAKRIISGDVAKITVTIPEGFTINQIERRLNEKATDWGEGKIKNFKIGDLKEDYDFLETAPFDANLQGFLFPAAYQFSYRVTAEEVARKMLDNFNKKLTPDLREEIRRQNKTIFEIVTMASLIEKEVRGLEDKKLVSGVLWKRRDVGMPLQVDATLAYILGERGWTFEEMLIEIGKARKIDSPYNTYMYLGLPIGPICNPGLESIIASVYPKDSPYWFYLSTPESETIFSKTYREHNLARAKYLR